MLDHFSDEVLGEAYRRRLTDIARIVGLGAQ
jgi:hypothetical protein